MGKEKGREGERRESINQLIDGGEEKKKGKRKIKEKKQIKIIKKMTKNK